MITGRYLLRILFIFLFSFHVCYAFAQPTLPDIAGSAGKGIVILSWTCQYNGIKSITVLRSMDSVGNYSAIGHVLKKGKGIQAFADGHPAAGKNFYKLAIVFNSGLSWSSNHCHVYVDRAMPGKSSMNLPENDSLQKFIVTEDITKPAVTDTITNSFIRSENNKTKSTQPRTDSHKLSKPDTTGLYSNKQKVNNIPTDTIRHRVVVSFVLDSVDVAADVSAGSVNSAPQKKKIIVTFEDPGENSVTFVKSRFIFTDSETGHVDMFLPDDVKSHHYSVKFYDEKGHDIIDIPKVNTSKIIIDKRNFQRSGTYKFVIRRDVTEFERGYITIDP